MSKRRHRKKRDTRKSDATKDSSRAEISSQVTSRSESKEDKSEITSYSKGNQTSRLSRLIRYAFSSSKSLTFWIGSLGGAITLLGNLEPFFQLADWAKYIVNNWRGWTHWVWDSLFAVFNIKISALSKNELTLIMLITALDLRVYFDLRFRKIPLTIGEWRDVWPARVRLNIGLFLLYVIVIMLPFVNTQTLIADWKIQFTDIAWEKSAGDYFIFIYFFSVYRPPVLMRISHINELMGAFVWKTLQLSVILLILSYMSMLGPKIIELLRPPL
jgi:hypothetical protein